jgi:hypothetical protein
MTADAVPTILARAAHLPLAERCALIADLAKRHGPPVRQDWRAWNLSRERARRALADHAPPQCSDWQPTE